MFRTLFQRPQSTTIDRESPCGRRRFFPQRKPSLAASRQNNRAAPIVSASPLDSHLRLEHLPGFVSTSVSALGNWVPAWLLTRATLHQKVGNTDLLYRYAAA